MRRAVLVLMAISALGITAAVASSFSVNTEDLQTFTTNVSISVPQNNLPPVLYVRTSGSDQTLDTAPPPGNDNVTSQEVKLDSATVEAQADPLKYVTWHSPTAPAGGYVLNGTVTLFIQQNGPGTNRMTAALLSCPAATPASSTTCTTIVVAVADINTAGGNGYKDREVHFGAVNFTIPQGNQLRLKIVNRAQQPPPVTVSTADWSLAWGFLPARQSRLEIT